MKAWFVGVVVLLAASHSAAFDFGKKAGYLNLYPLNSEARLERGPRQELVSHSSAENFAVGGRVGSTVLLLEVAKFSASSGNVTLSVVSNRREYMLWWKEYLYNFEYGDFFSTLGLGAYKEEVITTFTGTSVTDQGDSSVMGGAGLGLGSLLFDHVLVSVEARLLAGSNFDPNPSVGVLFRAGVEF